MNTEAVHRFYHTANFSSWLQKIWKLPRNKARRCTPIPTLQKAQQALQKFTVFRQNPCTSTVSPWCENYSNCMAFTVRVPLGTGYHIATPVNEHLCLSQTISKVPYSGKFSLVQIFAEKRPDSSEDIFTVYIFAERGTI